MGRWGLTGARTVLDLGCGVGHWGDLVEAALEPGAQITGVDREEAWVEAARVRAGGRPQRSFLQGAAEQLPFPAGSFDLVTCQTVLIHCPDPERVVAEMVRVTRGGGALLIAEPNNLGAVGLFV